MCDVVRVALSVTCPEESPGSDDSDASSWSPFCEGATVRVPCRLIETPNSWTKSGSTPWANMEQSRNVGLFWAVAAGAVSEIPPTTTAPTPSSTPILLIALPPSSCMIRRPIGVDTAGATTERLALERSPARPGASQDYGRDPLKDCASAKFLRTNLGNPFTRSRRRHPPGIKPVNRR